MKKANTAQKKWLADIVGWANNNLDYLFPEYMGEGFQIHHVLGRSAKHKKIAIGHEFIIPIPFDLHDVNSNHELNVTHHKHAFTNRYGKQSAIFERMVNSMECQGYVVPDSNVLYAIMDTRA